MPRDIALKDTKKVKKPPREVVTAQHALSKLKINSTDISPDDMGQFERLVPGLAVALKRAGFSVTQPILINHCKQGIEHVKELMKQLRAQQLAPVLNKELSYEILLERNKDQRPQPVKDVHCQGHLTRWLRADLRASIYDRRALAALEHHEFLKDAFRDFMNIDPEYFSDTPYLVKRLEGRHKERYNMRQYHSLKYYLMIRAATENDQKSIKILLKSISESQQHFFPNRAALVDVTEILDMFFGQFSIDITKDFLDRFAPIFAAISQRDESNLKELFFAKILESENHDVLKHFIDVYLHTENTEHSWVNYIDYLSRSLSADSQRPMLDYFFRAIRKDKKAVIEIYNILCSEQFHKNIHVSFYENVPIEDIIYNIDLQAVLDRSDMANHVDLEKILEIYKAGKLEFSEPGWFKKKHGLQQFTVLDRLACYFYTQNLAKNIEDTNLKLDMLEAAGWEIQPGFFKMLLQDFLIDERTSTFAHPKITMYAMHFFARYPEMFKRCYKDLDHDAALKIFTSALISSPSLFEIMINDKDFMDGILGEEDMYSLDILLNVRNYLLKSDIAMAADFNKDHIMQTIQNLDSFMKFLAKRDPKIFARTIGHFYGIFPKDPVEEHIVRPRFEICLITFFPYFSKEQIADFDIIKLLQCRYYRSIDILLKHGAKMPDLNEELQDKWQRYVEWKKTLAKLDLYFLQFPPRLYSESVFNNAQAALNAEQTNYAHYAVHACAFKTSQQLWEYVDRWGNFDRNTPLHDALQQITLPKELHADFDHGAWVAAIMRHGPKMARLFQYADRIPKPLKGADGGWSYTQTLAEVAKFAYARSNEYPKISGLSFRYKWPEEKFELATKLSEGYLKKYQANDNKKPNYIPDIEIAGAEFGKDSATFKKLPDGDIRGLFLGEMTDCCQHLNNAGRACAAHGFLSEYGGFYVLENQKGDIIAQMWAWRGKDDELVLDSFEQLRGHFNSKQVEGLLELFAEKVKTADTETPVTRVLIGTSGETPKDMKFAQDTQPAVPKDYNAYRDSNSQYLIKKLV